MRAKRTFLAAVALLAFGLRPCSAQQFVTTIPAPASSAGGDASGTIAVTNTFQKLFAGAGNSIAPTVGTPGARHGCSVQNNGTHTMYVSESLGVAASALTTSWQIAASGGLFNCNFGGVVLFGEIDITGTSGDTFVAKQF